MTELWIAIFFLLAGFGLLTGGAELLVRGASRLAAALGISPLVIGLTVVAFGTSAPELAVSVMSGMAGETNIALGNVLGSNIFNILFILGISALVAPLIVSTQLIKLDVPLMIAASALVFLFGANGVISTVEGVILFAGIIAYTLFLIMKSRKENCAAVAEIPAAKGARALLKNGFFVLAGLVLLVLGSSWLVKSAVTIAQHCGVSDLVIGLTIVAAGTSLPEAATSVVASLRGERDIAVGNIVGSNLFNLLCVLGAAAVVTKGGIPVPESVLVFDFPVMLTVALACLPVFFTGNVITRWEGALFFGYYIIYTVFLILLSTGSTVATEFRMAVLWFVLPLTAVAILMLVCREIRQNKKT